MSGSRKLELGSGGGGGGGGGGGTKTIMTSGPIWRCRQAQQEGENPYARMSIILFTNP